MGKKDRMDPYDKTLVDPLKMGQRNREDHPKKRFTITFTIMSGNEVDFGKIFTFNHDIISLGRNKANHLVLEDPRVSKNHCRIEVMYSEDLEQIIIKDLDSTNGTYVNGVAIKQSILKSGDKIEIGETVLRFGYNDEIEERYHSKLFTFASTDSLTGLYNKRYILNELENQIKMVKRSQRLFSIVLLDIDDFKKINDTCGHLAGDEYLKKIASTINANLREQDIASRFGGEEFLILLPETLIEGAARLAERVRKKIEELELTFQECDIKTTVSVGISQFDPETPDCESLIRSADVALYRAKKEGKNKVVWT